MLRSGIPLGSAEWSSATLPPSSSSAVERSESGVHTPSARASKVSSSLARARRRSSSRAIVSSGRKPVVKASLDPTLNLGEFSLNPGGGIVLNCSFAFGKFAGGCPSEGAGGPSNSTSSICMEARMSAASKASFVAANCLSNSSIGPASVWVASKAAGFVSTPDVGLAWSRAAT